MSTETKILSGHYSEDTAYLVQDYPYGFHLRCKIRFWLEVNGKGTRLWSQTTNPKRGDIWNKAKSSTYCVVGAMFLDENNHVCWNGLSIYDADKAGDFLKTYRGGMTPAQCDFVEKLSAAFAARELAKASALANPIQQG